MKNVVSCGAVLTGGQRERLLWTSMLRSGDMVRRGANKSEVSRRVGVERHTVAKYVSPGSGPPTSQRRQRKSQLEPFHDYLRGRLAQGCANAVVLLREISKRTIGCPLHHEAGLIGGVVGPRHSH